MFGKRRQVPTGTDSAPLPPVYRQQGQSAPAASLPHLPETDGGASDISANPFSPAPDQRQPEPQPIEPPRGGLRKVIVRQSAYEATRSGADHYPLVQGIIDYVNGMSGEGLYTRQELPPRAL